MLAVGVISAVAASCAHIFVHCSAGARVNQQGFGGDTFRIDDLMFIKQQLELVDKTTIAAIHTIAIDQMTDLHQHL
jgi:hypothetical protein